MDLTFETLFKQFESSLLAGEKFSLIPNEHSFDKIVFFDHQDASISAFFVDLVFGKKLKIPFHAISESDLNLEINKFSLVIFAGEIVLKTIRGSSAPNNYDGPYIDQTSSFVDQCMTSQAKIVRISLGISDDLNSGTLMTDRFFVVERSDDPDINRIQKLLALLMIIAKTGKLEDLDLFNNLRNTLVWLSLKIREINSLSTQSALRLSGKNLLIFGEKLLEPVFTLLCSQQETDPVIKCNFVHENAAQGELYRKLKNPRENAAIFVRLHHFSEINNQNWLSLKEWNLLYVDTCIGIDTEGNSTFEEIIYLIAYFWQLRQQMIKIQTDERLHKNLNME